MFCPKCGKEIPEGTAFCPACGQPVNGPVVGAARAPKVFPEGKSHLVYWVLGLYLGSLGIHNFYLGEKTQGIIKLLIPSNISEIPISKLIDFRNKNRDKILEFNRQIENVEDAIGIGSTEEKFVNSFNDANKELMQEIMLLSTRASIIPLATYMLINNPTALSEEYAKSILTALGIGLGGYFAVKKSFMNTNSKRSCKKYFTNVSSLR